MIHVLNLCYPHWRDLTIFESSPGGASSEKLRAECSHYVPSHFWPAVEPGTLVQGIRCEDLRRLTLPDGSFDLVVTQDVFEHVLQPDRAFSEVARILRPGGAHVFTVPLSRGSNTFVRAEMTPAGLRHLAAPNYHGNPISAEGALVGNRLGR
jgi:SAM-dependent methyltransferase